ncbi:MAG: rhodanese-like domain-containing protein [Myxococcales bacterium]|nr:rhodanese-like domain-containing protein [Myxococcales bacterium]
MGFTSFLGLVVASAVGWCIPSRPLDFKPLIERDHPGVPWISADALERSWTAGPVPVLLDVRTEAEFAVSHLRGAIRIDPEAPASAVQIPEGRPVIVYCSVGYRSAALGRRLQARGVEVKNLEGGLFQWANDGRPLVSVSGTAKLVHPYDAVWGRLLRPEARAPLNAP